MRITGTAASGMRAGMARLDAAAHDIAVAGIAGADGVPPIQAIQSELPDGGVTTRMAERAPGAPSAIDTTDAMIEAREATLTYRANASVMRAADTMAGALLDMRG